MINTDSKWMLQLFAFFASISFVHTRAAYPISSGLPHNGSETLVADWIYDLLSSVVVGQQSLSSNKGNLSLHSRKELPAHPRLRFIALDPPNRTKQPDRYLSDCFPGACSDHSASRCLRKVSRCAMGSVVHADEIQWIQQYLEWHDAEHKHGEARGNSLHSFCENTLAADHDLGSNVCSYVIKLSEEQNRKEAMI